MSMLALLTTALSSPDSFTAARVFPTRDAMDTSGSSDHSVQRGSPGQRGGSAEYLSLKSATQCSQWQGIACSGRFASSKKMPSKPMAMTPRACSTQNASHSGLLGQVAYAIQGQWLCGFPKTSRFAYSAA